MTHEVPEFGFATAEPRHTAAYLRPALEPLVPPGPAGRRMLDIGCGNGYWVGQFLAKGWECVGADPSEQGIGIARKAYPAARFHNVVVEENFLSKLSEQPFDLVVSTEVVEHLYAPRAWAKAAFQVLKPGGRLICSTPYHGYLKNLTLSIAGKWDWHLKPLWDGGHIKFWSRDTLGQLLTELGFTNIQFRGAGRAPYLWMSMVMSGDRPG